MSETKQPQQEVVDRERLRLLRRIECVVGDPPLHPWYRRDGSVADEGELAALRTEIRALRADIQALSQIEKRPPV